MSSPKEDLNLELALSSFRDEVLHKQMLIQSLAFEFEKIHDEKANSTRSTIQCIKMSRNIMNEVDGILQTIRLYLVQLKLGFFYDLLLKTFRILVMIFNFLSSKFADSLRKIKTTEPSHQKNFPRKTEQEVRPSGKQKGQLKEMQYFDFMIKNLEQEEFKLNQRKRVMEKQLMQDCKSISNITASGTVGQLETLNKDLLRIISNSQKIAGENVLFRYQELSKRILSLKKPDEINNEFCENISNNMREKFLHSMEKLLKQMSQAARQKEREQIFRQVANKREELREYGVQTDSDTKTKQIQQLSREKKLLANQLETSRKSNVTLQAEVEKLFQKSRAERQLSRILERKLQDLEGLAKKKANELQILRNQNQRLAKKNQQCLHLDKKSESGVNFNKTNSLTQEAEPELSNSNGFRNFQQYKSLDFESLRSSKYKQPKISSYILEKESQTHKKQNGLLRNCIEKVVGKLAQLNIIRSDSASSIVRDIKVSDLIKKIDQFFMDIEGNEEGKEGAVKKEYRASTVKQVNFNFRQHEIGIQTESTKEQPGVSGTNMPKQHANRAQKNSRLEQLKQQFLRNLRKKKENEAPLSKDRRKNNIPEVNNQTECFLDQTQEAVENDAASMPNQKSKAQIYCKDISFESFTLAKVERRPDKKVVGKSRKYQISKTENSQAKPHMEQRLTNKPLISLESYEVLKQIKPILQMIEARNDVGDYFLNNFLRSLLGEFTKMRGRSFMENFLSKQLGEIGLGFSRNQARSNKRVQVIETAPLR